MSIWTILDVNDWSVMVCDLLKHARRFDIKNSKNARFKPCNKLEVLWISRDACADICIWVAKLVSLLKFVGIP
jgi:hypothetical protein